MAAKVKQSKFGRLKQFPTPQTIDAPPLVPIVIAGEQRNLRFDMKAVGLLERSLGKDVIDILRYLSGAAAGARFNVQVILAVIAAGISHEYEKGAAPEWEDLGEHFPNLNHLTPLLKPALDALTGALVDLDKAQDDPDPNAPKPAAQSTGLPSTDLPAAS